MKTLSKTEYENETDLYKLVDIKLVDIRLPTLYFAKTAICAAKSVRHLIREKDKKVCFSALETAEKYLTGEATKKECKKAAEKAYGVYFTNTYIYSPDAVRAAEMTFIYATNAAVGAHLDVYVKDLAVKPYYTSYHYDAVYAVKHASKATRSDTCNNLRQAITWEFLCGFQIAKCFGRKNNEKFIREIMKDENLMNYATILLEDENSREEFQFLMKGYVENENFIEK